LLALLLVVVTVTVMPAEHVVEEAELGGCCACEGEEDGDDGAHCVFGVYFGENESLRLLSRGRVNLGIEFSFLSHQMDSEWTRGMKLRCLDN
jgi:hypothetical protein